VSSLHIQFLSPLPPGLGDIFAKFRRVITVELNYSDDWNDPLITKENRRYGQLAWVLRASTLVDIDCFARVPGRPYMPVEIVGEVKRILGDQPAIGSRSETPTAAKGVSG
jgi:2-oxoglutarate ferredoxin oxidoreductase subunit alpha